MSVYVDTSALYALIDSRDPAHSHVRATWRTFRSADEDLVTSNYVLVETAALLGNRLGIEAVRAFHGNLAPLLVVNWVDAGLHDRSVSALLTANRRRLSLVDCVGFEIMRRQGLNTAFAVDAHFVEQGFRCLPGFDRQV